MLGLVSLVDMSPRANRVDSPVRKRGDGVGGRVRADVWRVPLGYVMVVVFVTTLFSSPLMEQRQSVTFKATRHASSTRLDLQIVVGSELRVEGFEYLARGDVDVHVNSCL